MGCLGLHLQTYRGPRLLNMFTEAETPMISQQLVSHFPQLAIKDDLIYNPTDSVRQGFIKAASLATPSRVALNLMKARSVAVRPEFLEQLASVDVDCKVSCKFRKF
jgi:hypothetical protein